MAQSSAETEWQPRYKEKDPLFVVISGVSGKAVLLLTRVLQLWLHTLFIFCESKSIICQQWSRRSDIFLFVNSFVTFLNASLRFELIL